MFTEPITEYRDAHDEVVITARTVAVLTERTASERLRWRSASCSGRRPKELVLVDDLTRTQIVHVRGRVGRLQPAAQRRDVRHARSPATRAIFAHGMLTMGMTGRMVTDWFGVGRLTSTACAS